MIFLLHLACADPPGPGPVPPPDDEPTGTEDTDSATISSPVDTADTGLDPYTAPLFWLTAEAGTSAQSCGLVSDGTVRCWGTPECEARAPEPTEAFDSISVGLFGTCGLRPDGTLRCWCCTGNECIQPLCAEVPVGVFSRVEVGNWDACAQDAAGELTCWGGHEILFGSVPAGPVLDFAVENTYACAVLPDATLTCWGYAMFWDEPPAGVAIADISLGRGHACALDPSGTAHCWGINLFGDPFPAAPVGQFVRIDSFNQVSCGVDAADLVTCVYGLENGWFDLWLSQMPAEPLAYLGLSEWDGCGVNYAGEATCWGGPLADEPWLRVPDLNP